jgi:hypothetical protein
MKFKVWRYGSEKTGKPVELDIGDGSCPACRAVHERVRPGVTGILFVQVLDEAECMKLYRVEVLGPQTYLCGEVELAEADAEIAQGAREADPKPRERTGAEELRIIVRNLGITSESFNERFTAEQLIQIGRMQLACGWDFLPDRWKPRQVREALRGIVPAWDADEKPLYAGVGVYGEAVEREEEGS